MSYLHCSISILENYTDTFNHQIALVLVETLQNSINFNGIFEVIDASELEIGSPFLRTTEYTNFPKSFRDDFLNIFTNFPDVCFCLFFIDEDDETASDYRVLFFNGKAVTQYPEIRYPEFHVNDFEYEASNKVVLPTVAPLEPMFGKILQMQKKADERMAGKTAEELYDEAKERGINERIATICNMMRQGVIPLGTDSAILDLIRKNLYGNIIAENSQDA